MCVQGLEPDGLCGFMAYAPIHQADAVDLHGYFRSCPDDNVSCNFLHGERSREIKVCMIV